MHSPPFQIVALNSNEPPPATPVEAVQQTKISSAEKSAEDLETILNVAGSSIRSIISNLQAPISTSSSTTPPIIVSRQHPDDRWNELKQMFKDLEDEWNNNNISTENLYDELLEHNNSPLSPPPQTTPAPHSTAAGYIPHKQMPSTPPPPLSPSPSPRITGYVAHKQMPPPPSPQHQSVATSPIPLAPRTKNYGTQMSPPQLQRQRRRQREYGTQMDNDIRTHNKIRSIFEDFCKGKTNTRHTTHRIMDIAHQVAKDNIR